MNSYYRNETSMCLECIPERTPWILFLLLITVFLVSQHQVKPVSLVEHSITGDMYAQQVSDGSCLNRIVYVGMGFLGCILIMIKGKYKIRPGKIGWIIVCYGLWSFLSIIWAEDHVFCIRRAVILAMFALAAFGIVKQWSINMVIRWIYFSYLFFLVVGILSELIYGTLLPFSSGYRFGGTLHPNSQGLNCGILLLSGFAIYESTFRWRSIIVISMLTSLVCLLFTGSRTAVASTIIAASMFVSLRWKSKLVLAVIYLSIIALFATLVLDLNNKVAEVVLLGRTGPEVKTFTSRLPIWSECFGIIKGNVLCGVGYGSFWTPDRIVDISHNQNWAMMGSSHSVYIEVILGTGLVGLLCYINILFFSIIKAYYVYKKTKDVGFLFNVCTLSLMTINGVLESISILPSQFLFVLIVLLLILGFQYNDDYKSVTEGWAYDKYH